MHSLHDRIVELSPFHMVKVAVISTFVVAVFCITAAVSVFALHETRRRKLLVGSIGLCVSVALYGSPLVAMKKVIKTKSVEFMPLPLSLCAFSASVLWLGYGILIRDVFVAGSSVVGTPLSILQLVIYFKYRKERVVDEAEIEDLEKGGLELEKVVELELELELGKEEKIVTNCEQQ
ncbi:hypothetical protein KIW84_052428 [Lathyrus oleraceus]|uniref:Uncharacterized protein n=1 Tax=Pisum sativum TaxID=3888 RepID=A0A9D4WS38_PEA|nr:hypothetical protein KIW84_052428 [Pisum sativum]